MESSRTSSRALASKLKFLAWASKPASSRKCPVLGSRTGLFFNWLIEENNQTQNQQKPFAGPFVSFPYLKNNIM